MKKSIFEYRDYKVYLNDFIVSRPGKGRGIKAKIAKNLRIHTAYVSQVLNKYAHFTLEQSVSLSHFLEHTQNETRFFIYLIQLGRSGSHELRTYFQSEIEKFASDQSKLKNRLETEDEITPIDQQTYYSSWHYTAVHALISVEQFQDREIIRKRLNLSIERINEILEFLLKTGLIDRSGNRFIMGAMDIHLSDEGPMINKHHSNWRLKAIEALDKKTSEDLHYSGIISIKREDALTIKNILIKSLQDVRKIINDSDEEEVYVYTMDMFPLN
jgi:uncharacterized protein (TIGR02147 family)